MSSSREVRIPKAFYDDHESRELPTPAIVRRTASHYFIDRTDPAFAELVDDARYYVDGNDCEWSLKMAARALVRALTVPTSA